LRYWVLNLGGVLAAGLFIWRTIPERAAALLAGLIVLGMTILVIRRGALRPRVVVELRQEAPDYEPSEHSRPICPA
jgi:hypothetical protein